MAVQMRGKYGIGSGFIPRSVRMTLVVVITCMQIVELCAQATPKLSFSEAGEVANADGWLAFRKHFDSRQVLEVVNVVTLERFSVKLDRPAAPPLALANVILQPYVDGKYDMYSFTGRLIGSGQLPIKGYFGGAEILSMDGRIAVLEARISENGKEPENRIVFLQLVGDRWQVVGSARLHGVGPMVRVKDRLFIFLPGSPLEIPVPAH
jgi:hypothetical protein